MGKNKFNAGDLVIYSYSTSDELEEGQLYTVLRADMKHDEPSITLDGQEGWWREARFELYSSSIKYDVIKSFSIIDIYKKAPCSGDFIALLKENGSRDIDASWNEFRWIKKSPVLMRNLGWLEENGFITKKKEVWVNVYMNSDNKSFIGDNKFESKEAAMSGKAYSESTYVGPVKKF